MAVLAVLGLGVGDKLASRLLYVDGTPTKRAHELALREFGNEEAFIVVLRGPRLAVETQGRELVDRIGSNTDALVISPWASGREIRDLRPKPGIAALLVNVTPNSGESTIDVATSIQQQVTSSVSEPVRASIAGGPTLVSSYNDAAEEAAAVGERIALPVLLIVLLLVFRSVVAAAIPVLVGGAVVSATRGVMDISLGVINIESFALGAVGMIGLALGVDYSLLVVSRFREEMKIADDVEEAVQATVRYTGRAIIPAGSGLIFATLAATLVLPSPLLTSVGFVVIAVTVLSVLSALLVVPAALTLLGPNLDRWTLPIRGGEGSAASRWSRSLSRRPLVLGPVMFVLLACAGWAFALKSEAGTNTLLPADDSGRLQQEEVERALGPGWVAPLEVVMDGRGSPVTTPERLRALAAFQRRVEADPGVSTMVGLGPIERSTRQLGGLERSLITQGHGLTRLARGISRAQGGSAAASGGVAQAATGATTLGTAIGAAGNGAGSLADGLDAAGSGSRRLAGGLDRAGSGTGQLAGGVAKASAGSARLAGGLDRALNEAGEAGSGRVLKNALRSGDKSLEGLHSPLRATEEQLAIARQALQAMTSGRSDPQYDTALRATEAAGRHLTGTDPSTGEPVDPSYDGVDAGIKHAQNQFNLGIYLGNRIDKSGSEARAGLGKLAKSSEHLADGLNRLKVGSQEISDQIVRLASGGQQLPPGLQRLAEGAKRLATGLGEANAGINGLAGGLGEGTQKFNRLTDALGRIHAGVERQTSSGGSGSAIARLQDQSPGLFRSGYFYLASLDGSKPDQHRQAAFLINLNHGGRAARMLIIPRDESGAPQAQEMRDRLQGDAADLARETDAKVIVGGIGADQVDLNSFYRGQAPLLRLALMLVSMLVLIPVLRSLLMPLVAALLNLITVGASFGLLALLFNGSLLGGPGYVDATIVTATIMVMFGLGIDYEVFIFARMREEYLKTGSPSAAITNGIDHTAHVVTGAAIIMIAVFVAFSFSSFVTFRNFGVGLAIAVFIDAFIVRMIIMPAVMRSMGKWAWWMPNWLDRLLPGGTQPSPAPRATSG
jgi:RND superfamily putative drug exporter